jgi:hypothetical protein
MQSLQKSKKNLFLIVLLIIVLSGSIFLVYRIFWKKNLKKELVYSIQVVPNNAAETKINFNNAITVKFPRGIIKNPDTLDIYNVTEIGNPDDVEEHIKTYDIGLRKTDKPADYFEIELSYANEFSRGEIDDSKQVLVKQFDEKNNKWNDIIAEVDRVNKKLIITTNHFSLYSIFKDELHIPPHPMMKVTTYKTLNQITALPSVEASMRMIDEYGRTSKPPEEARKTAINVLEDAFNWTSQGTTLGEEILKLPICEKFNELAGYVGVALAIKQFAVETYEGKIELARLNAYKNAYMITVGFLGNSAMKIASVGVFFLEISLQQFGEKGMEIRESNYQAIYDNWNNSWNQYRKKSDDDWKNFVIELIRTKDDFNAEIDNYVNAYLNDAFNEIGSEIPENLRETVRNKEKYRLYKIFNSMKSDIEYVIQDKQKREIAQKLNELIALLNSEFRISANVYGSGSDREGLPINVVVKNDQNLWAGKTNEAGTWHMNCTNIGFIVYGGPMVGSLTYKGNTLADNIRYESRGGFMEFRVDEVNTSQVNNDFDASLAGTYKGKIITDSFKNNIASKEGPFEATVDANGNVTMKASFTVISEFKSSDGYIRETQQYELSGSGKFKKVGGKPGEYIAHVKVNMHLNSFDENKSWDNTTTHTYTSDNQSVMGLYLKGNRMYNSGGYRIEASK